MPRVKLSRLDRREMISVTGIGDVAINRRKTRLAVPACPPLVRKARRANNASARPRADIWAGDMRGRSLLAGQLPDGVGGERWATRHPPVSTKHHPTSPSAFLRRLCQAIAHVPETPHECTALIVGQC